MAGLSLCCIFTAQCTNIHTQMKEAEVIQHFMQLQQKLGGLLFDHPVCKSSVTEVKSNTNLMNTENIKCSFLLSHLITLT